MTSRNPPVLIFCALPCEAKPLIKAWRLPGWPSADHPFAIYAGDGRAVVVTGPGKVNMAGAIGYALASFNKPQAPILINLGIAGHPSETIGTLCLGHKIIDQESGRCFYPQMPFGVNHSTYEVITHSQPHMDYQGYRLYDMEAAGFYELAVKFSSSELVQVVKIVSDNMQSSVANITESLVEEWMQRQVSAVEELVSRLIDLWSMGMGRGKACEPYHQITSRFHFTVSHALKLKDLLRRWHALKGNETIMWPEAGVKNAKELLIWIEQQLDCVDFYL